MRVRLAFFCSIKDRAIFFRRPLVPDLLYDEGLAAEISEVGLATQFKNIGI